MDDKFNKWVVCNLPIWLVQRLHKAHETEQASADFDKAIVILDSSIRKLYGNSASLMIGVVKDDNIITEKEINEFDDYLQKAFPKGLPE